ncbi:MAG: hypothetical protein WCJ30_22460, partial [Deltaproteobacteria bacterium]
MVMMAATAGSSELSASSQLLLQVLKHHCSLAWPIMKTQCALVGLDPAALRPGDIAAVVPAIVVALARF